MSDTQHTLGPWQAEWVPKGRRPWVGRLAEGRWAALACGDTDEEAAANARLIAASPDTLAALEGLLWAVTGFGGFEAQYPEEVAAARAAIAKATGQ